MTRQDELAWSGISEVMSKAEYERRGHFCSVLARPDTLPWFIAHVQRYVELLDERPTWFDVQMTMKWSLLNKGLAATPYLVEQCKKNKGTFSSSVREYRLPTNEETLEALVQAMKQHGIIAGVGKP